MKLSAPRGKLCQAIISRWCRPAAGLVLVINANLGDKVKKGDVLFEVEDDDVRANFDDNEIQRLSAQAAIHRLVAEQRCHDNHFSRRIDAAPSDRNGLSFSAARKHWPVKLR